MICIKWKILWLEIAVLFSSRTDLSVDTLQCLGLLFSHKCKGFNEVAFLSVPLSYRPSLFKESSYFLNETHFKHLKFTFNDINVTFHLLLFLYIIITIKRCNNLLQKKFKNFTFKIIFSWKFRYFQYCIGTLMATREHHTASTELWNVQICRKIVVQPTTMNDTYFIYLIFWWLRVFDIFDEAREIYLRIMIVVWIMNKG